MCLHLYHYFSIFPISLFIHHLLHYFITLCQILCFVATSILSSSFTYFTPGLIFFDLLVLKFFWLIYYSRNAWYVQSLWLFNTSHNLNSSNKIKCLMCIHNLRSQWYKLRWKLWERMVQVKKVHDILPLYI